MSVKFKIYSWLLVVFLMTAFFVNAQTSAVQTTDELLKKLPETLRENGRKALAENDGKDRAEAIVDLYEEYPDETLEFLIAVLEVDAAAKVRLDIVNEIGSKRKAVVRKALEQRVTADTDADVALLALDKLRSQSTAEMRDLLNRRIEAARKNADEKNLPRLLQEQERWISLVRGTMLPAYLRQVPPQFSVKGKGKSVRIVAFGDQGNGSKEQKQVAAAMLAHHKKKKFDFGIVVGDNFYDDGAYSPTEERWKTWWSDFYDPLKIKYYVVLGNHDWRHPDSPAAEIQHTNLSKSWRMPAPYYTFTAGDVQFFAVDTNEFSELQLQWFKNELDKSTARWKIVFGHHPIYTIGKYKNDKRMQRTLLPLLKNKVDFYISGHEHNLQQLKPEDGVNFLITGGGGRHLHKFEPNERAVFAEYANGFLTLDINETEIKFSFIGANGKVLHENIIKKQ